MGSATGDCRRIASIYPQNIIHMGKLTIADLRARGYYVGVAQSVCDELQFRHMDYFSQSVGLRLFKSSLAMRLFGDGTREERSRNLQIQWRYNQQDVREFAAIYFSTPPLDPIEAILQYEFAC